MLVVLFLVLVVEKKIGVIGNSHDLPSSKHAMSAVGSPISTFTVLPGDITSPDRDSRAEVRLSEPANPARSGCWPRRSPPPRSPAGVDAEAAVAGGRRYDAGAQQQVGSPTTWADTRRLAPQVRGEHWALLAIKLASGIAHFRNQIGRRLPLSVARAGGGRASQSTTYSLVWMFTDGCPCEVRGSYND